MFNKLKVKALDVAIKEMEALLNDYHITVETNRYFNNDSKHEKAVMAGIRAAVDVCYEIRKKHIKR